MPESVAESRLAMEKFYSDAPDLPQTSGEPLAFTTGEKERA